MGSHVLGVVMHACKVLSPSGPWCSLLQDSQLLLRPLKAVRAAALQRAFLPRADVAVAAAKKNAAVGSTASQSSASGKLAHLPKCQMDLAHARTEARCLLYGLAQPLNLMKSPAYRL